MFRKTPRGLRLHLVILGRRNVGKSSILNCLVQQQVSIVSDIPGTTTDPVEKRAELLPIGPVNIIDTAGLDDEGKLGDLRVKKTLKVLKKADLIILVTECDTWTDYEEEAIKKAEEFNIPLLVLLNKIDIKNTKEEIRRELEEKNIPYLEICALEKGWQNTSKIKEKIIEILPSEWLKPKALVSDLVNEGDLVILVAAKDIEMPKGRIKLPQEQVLRELLDSKAMGLLLEKDNLKACLESLNIKPKLVICESHIFNEVIKILPLDFACTTFSILFSRYKGDLEELTRGVYAIEKLKPGDKILIAEACTHHPIGDDIGRVQIPNMISERVGRINFDVYAGEDFPENLSEYKLIISCGSCMLNRKQFLSRIYQAKSQNIPITNYGIVFAYLNQNLERALEPFGLSKPACCGV